MTNLPVTHIHSMNSIGIIGGSGLEKLDMFTSREEIKITTLLDPGRLVELLKAILEQ